MERKFKRNYLLLVVERIKFVKVFNSTSVFKFYSLCGIEPLQS